MRKSKNIFQNGLIVLLMILSISCNPGDSLDVSPRGSLSEDVVASVSGAETQLIGAYGAIDGQFDFGSAWEKGVTNWVYGAIAGGMAHKGSSSNDQAAINAIARMSMTPVNAYLNSQWKALYEGVKRSNSVLQILEEADGVTEEDYNTIAAEARFLRAHFYFELKKMWGNVPWIDETTEKFKQPNVGEGAVDIWDKIETDFTFAMNNLPEIQSEIGRANKWAAAAYLAKTYVFQQKWNEAKTIYDDVIPNGVTASGEPYELVDHFEDNFKASTEHGSETVFDAEFAANVGTGTADNARQENMLNFPYNSPFGCCGFFQPTQDLVNSFRTDGDGLPIIDRYNDISVTSDTNVPSNQRFVTYAGTLDPRLDWTVGRRGVPYHDWGPFPGARWVRDQSNGGPYHAKKHVYWQANQDQYSDQSEFAPGSAINHPIIRFADVLLMAAEVEVEVGSLEKARMYVNQVRERITNPDGWVDNSLNEAFALTILNNEQEMLNSGALQNQWIVRKDRNSTFVLLREPATNVDNWQEYPNPIQNYRISTYPGPWTNKDAARQFVHYERKLELALEGHRFFDLVRWGEAEEKLNAFYQYEGGQLGYKDVAGSMFNPGKNEYYPIPQRQIDLSTSNGKATLKQNSGY